MVLGDKGREALWENIPGAGANERSDGQSFRETRARRFWETDCSLRSACEKMEGKDGECDVTSCPKLRGERLLTDVHTDLRASDISFTSTVLNGDGIFRALNKVANLVWREEK